MANGATTEKISRQRAMLCSICSRLSSRMVGGSRCPLYRQDVCHEARPAKGGGRRRRVPCDDSDGPTAAACGLHVPSKKPAVTLTTHALGSIGARLCPSGCRSRPRRRLVEANI